MHQSSHRFGGSRTVAALLSVIGVMSIAVATTAQDAITDIAVVGGGADVECPAGLTKINVDLNRGAGGDLDYIFLCYKKGAGAPISDITVVGGGAPDVECPAGLTRIPYDLNTGVGGDYIYLCYTEGLSCNVLSDISVVVGQHTECPAGFTRDPYDLNSGARGNYLWLCYSRSATARSVCGGDCNGNGEVSVNELVSG